jgi:hypothetical protein
MDPPKLTRECLAAAAAQDALGALRRDYNLGVYVQDGYANRTAVTAHSDIDVIAALAGNGVRVTEARFGRSSALKGARDDELWEGEDRAQGSSSRRLLLAGAPAGRGRRQLCELPPASPGREERHPR